MKIIITEEQYGHLVTNLLDLLLGNITIKTVKEKKEEGIKESYHSVFNEDGETVMTIWVKGSLRSKGCKKDLTLENSLIEKFEQYMPYYKHKMFSKVLVDYIYDKFGIKCDCVQYDYDFKEEKHVDDEGDEYEYTDSKTRKYNVKKKKKIKESVDNSNIVEQLLELEDIKIDFEYIDGRVLDNNELEEYIGTTVIDDDEIEDSLGGGAKIYIQEVYVHFYNNNNELIINYHTSPTIYFITKNNKVIGVNSHNRFTDIATSFRYIPYKILNSYFIERAKTYLEDFLSDGNYLNESVEDSNVVEQIMEVEGVKYDGCGYGGRTYDNFGRRHDTVEVYFKLPDEEKLYSRRIHFLTKKNKVVSVDSTGDFRTITDGFRYIPTDILMGYFIEKAKTYVEKLLRTLYPNDSR